MDLAYSAGGLTRFAVAKLTGNVRSENELAAIAKVCEKCLSLKVGRTRITRQGRGYCGPVGENYLDSVMPTCGCKVMEETTPALAHVTIKGVPMRAAGKPVNADEGCPQRLWP